jgi:hypothetical protein
VSGTDSHYHIDVEEPPNCDVLKALQFMHADVPALDLQHCSALRYAHTAHFLDMRRLSEEVVECAAAVIRSMAASVREKDSDEDAPHGSDSASIAASKEDSRTGSSSNTSCGTSVSDFTTTTRSNSRISGDSGLVPPRLMSPWDAIAVLTLLGDSQQALPLVSLKLWYQR